MSKCRLEIVILHALTESEVGASRSSAGCHVDRYASDIGGVCRVLVIMTVVIDPYRYGSQCNLDHLQQLNQQYYYTETQHSSFKLNSFDTNLLLFSQTCDVQALSVSADTLHACLLHDLALQRPLPPLRLDIPAHITMFATSATRVFWLFRKRAIPHQFR